jgi:hypothetical protein
MTRQATTILLRWNGVAYDIVGVETNRRADKIARRRRIANVTGGCDRCPPHAKENARLKGRKPRDDRHKNHR